MRRLSNSSSAPAGLFPVRSATVSKIAFALSFFAAVNLALASCGARTPEPTPADTTRSEEAKRPLEPEQSATAISREVKEVFERAAKAVVKVHGVDEHS